MFDTKRSAQIVAQLISSAYYTLNVA